MNCIAPIFVRVHAESKPTRSVVIQSLLFGEHVLKALQH